MTRYQRFSLTLILAAACLAAGCGKKHEKIDLSGSGTTTAAAETMEETPAQTEEETTAPETAASSAPAGSVGETASAAGSYAVAPVSYQAGNISVRYPALTPAKKNTLTDEQAAKVNDLLKQNILGVIDAYGLKEEEDSLDLNCRIVSSDRSRLTVIYTGKLKTAKMTEAVNLFFSNTVDVNKAANVGLSRFVDPYTMAGYVLSNDCYFTAVDGKLSADTQASLLQARTAMTIEQYYKLFQNADFPAEPDEKTGFPGSFSYEMDGSVIFSIPVSHELGDYALVAYTPETK